MSLYITADIVLIESDWNLKLFSLYGIGWPVICINRIRLEFKENKIGEGVKSWDSINRIRLEFKVHRHGRYASRNGVLIESDWNLKKLRGHRTSPARIWY